MLNSLYAYYIQNMIKNKGTLKNSSMKVRTGADSGSFRMFFSAVVKRSSCQILLFGFGFAGRIWIENPGIAGFAHLPENYTGAVNLIFNSG